MPAPHPPPGQKASRRRSSLIPSEMADAEQKGCPSPGYDAVTTHGPAASSCPGPRSCCPPSTVNTSLNLKGDRPGSFAFGCLAAGTEDHERDPKASHLDQRPRGSRPPLHGSRLSRQCCRVSRSDPYQAQVRSRRRLTTRPSSSAHSDRRAPRGRRPGHGSARGSCASVW
jgi:hypothetical protein